MTQPAAYTPSWVNRLTDWIRRVPLPGWNIYALLLIVLGSMGWVGRWIAGVLPAGTWSAYDVYDTFSGPVIFVAILAFHAYLDGEIADAAAQSRPLANLSDERFSQLTYVLIVMPAAPMLVVSILGFAASIQPAMETYGFTRVTLSNALVLFDWGLTAAMTFGYIYRVVLLIVRIGRFYAGSINVSLYNLPPIYKLSTVSGKVGFFLLVLWYANIPLNLNKTILNSPLYLGITFLVSMVPLAAFLVPLGTVNRRLAREKSQKIVDVSQQIEIAFEKLEHAFDAERLSEMKDLEAAISNLVSKKQYIESIPTWPWRQGTFRVALTAVFLPLIVWFV